MDSHQNSIPLSSIPILLLLLFITHSSAAGSSPPDPPIEFPKTPMNSSADPPVTNPKTPASSPAVAPIMNSPASPPVRNPTTPAASGSLSPEDACIGVYLKYSLLSRVKIRPFLPKNAKAQPFAFKSTVLILNTDSVPIDIWYLHIGFPNGTVLVSASSSTLSDSSPLPYIVGSNDTTGVTLIGSPNIGLKTAIETAGDMNQVQALVDITGTDFGTVSFNAPAPLPRNLTLDDPKYICKALPVPPKSGFMHTCCVLNPKYKPNTTTISEHFLARRTGDLTIDYDVLQAYESSYMARVTIKNQNSLGRLDNWKLSWQWMQGEFLLKMQGAVTTTSDISDCVYGPQGQFYKEFDFSTVLNCNRRPTIIDLPVTMANDDNLGRIPFCCRNGTILPATIDPLRSVSAFQMQVFKMPPYLNRTELDPPQSWAIAGSNGALNPYYTCAAPIRVSPSVFPSTSGLPTSSSAIATWQVVCNITTKNKKPRCCVSFSAFYNDSAVPCKTCACGCPAGKGGSCSTTTPAMLIPPDGLLKPFDNRTVQALEWAQIKHFSVPRPLPCGDNCGVSINWHVYTDYSNGWSVRITLFNWEAVDIPDWFAAVVLPRAYDGFQAVYSFNGTAVGNSTLFIEGLPGLNYLMRVSEGPYGLNPGKLQSVMSFTKKNTPMIDVVAGDGYPRKVFFNGEECSIPDRIPTAAGGWKVMGSLWSVVVGLVMAAMLLIEL